MAAKPEVKVKKRINQILEEHGAVRVDPIMGGMGQNGTHDKINCINGFFVSIEAKAGRNYPTLLQCQFGKQVWDANGLALVINEANVEDLHQICLALKSGELDMWMHGLTRQEIKDQGGIPIPFELFRRQIYLQFWRPWLNNDKRMKVGSVPKYDMAKPVDTPAPERSALAEAVADA